MRIALVIDRLDPGQGGAEKSLFRILEALRERGHDLSLAAMDWAEPVAELCQCHRIEVPRWPRSWRDWAFATQSRAFASRFRPGVVLAVRHVLAADVFLARGGLHCETIEGNLRAHPSGWKRLIYRIQPKHRVLLALEQRLFMQANPPFVITPSAMVADHFVKHFRMPKDRLAVVPTGADLERLRPMDPKAREEVRRRLGLGNQVAGLFAAHNFELKGLGCLLEAWSRLEAGRFSLLVAGRDRWTGKVPANVRFLGSQTEMRDLFQSADFLAHPTFYDPFSRVVIEALACGLPVVTTRYNGAAELIHDGKEGFILEDPRDVGLLAARLEELHDPALRARMSVAARQLAERHPESDFLNRTADLIELQARDHRKAL